jgi:small membrane protein
MIIRVVLLSCLAAIGWLVFLRRTKLPFHIVIVFAVLAVAGLAVVFPDLTDEAAKLVGVGRGADLVTYLVEIGTLFVLLHYYTKFVELERRVTELVREIAILRAEVDRTTSSTAPASAGAASTAGASGESSAGRGA